MKLLVVVGEADAEALVAVDQLSLTHDVTVVATRPFDAPEGVRVERSERAAGALEFLHAHGREYDAVLFYGSADETCAAGVAIVPERAALIPAVRDASTLERRTAPALFQLPRAVGFESAAEESLVRAKFRNGRVPGERLDEEGGLDRLLALVTA